MTKLSPSAKPFARLRVALIADELTRGGLKGVCQITHITPYDYLLKFALWKPDILLIESSWSGVYKSWKYKIASYPKHPKRTNIVLKRVTDAARARGIPVAFWNKEDGVHFDRFIDSAVFADHIFTTDANVIPKYKQQCPNARTVKALKFAVNPTLHYPDSKSQKASVPFCFAGSYREDLHPERRVMQDQLFSVAKEKGLDIYDRNSDRKSHVYRFPPPYDTLVRPGVVYTKTGGVYRQYKGCLNVNTVVDSPTMFSRRAVEVMACGVPLITTPSLAMTTLFDGLVNVVDSPEATRAVLDEIIHDSASIRERAAAASETIIRDYSYTTWLEHILNTIK